MDFESALRWDCIDQVSSFERMLVSCDGTLTTLLEAIYCEPITVVILSNTLLRAQCPVVELDLLAEQSLLSREVLICGAYSNRQYLYAQSQIAIDKLPTAVQRELLECTDSIGRIWTRNKVEGRKEFLSIAICSNENGVIPFLGPEGVAVRRSYRWFSGGSPAMIISEYFRFERRETVVQPELQRRFEETADVKVRQA